MSLKSSSDFYEQYDFSYVIRKNHIDPYSAESKHN